MHNEAIAYPDRSYGDKWREIYIDNKKRHATKSQVPHLSPDFVGEFFVDSQSLPFRRCSGHSLSREAAAHLERGGRVKTSGHWYSLKPEPNKES